MFITLEEKLLFSALDNHPEPIVLHTPVFAPESDTIIDFTFVYFNHAASQQAAPPYALTKGQKVSEMQGFSQEVRKKIFQQLLDVYTSGNDLQITNYNEVLDVHFEVRRRKIEGGVLSITKNINAEIKEQLKKQEQQELVNLILTSSLDGWYVLDVVLDDHGGVVDFIFTRVNNKFLQLSGLAEEQVMGKKFLQLFPAAKDIGSFQRYEEVYLTGISDRRQSHYKAGALDAWYDSVAAKLGDHSVLVTFSDITEIKAKGEEIETKNYILDKIFTHSSNGISFGKVIRNAEGKIVDGIPIMANEAAFQLTGIPKEVYFSKTSVELEPNIVNTPYFRKIVHTMETGEPSIVEYQLESTGRWIEISLSRMDQDHLIIIFTDVTEIKETQLQKERLIEELKRTNAALEEFTRAASHDLKEPIRKVHIFTQRLHQKLDGKMDEEERGLIEKVKTSASRMMMLVEDLLSYSDISYKTQDLEEIDLNEKLQHVLSDLELVIQEKNARIDVGNLPVIKGYRRQLAQLFQNLIGNALKYTKPDEQPVIRIRARKIRKEELPANFIPASENYHLIEVEDNGIGFNQQDAERIFNVFIRLHGKERYSGTGIGLSIVKKVAENHGGFVYARSEEGKGATFSVLLPETTNKP
jgi:signal transduction histidine kinase